MLRYWPANLVILLLLGTVLLWTWSIWQLFKLKRILGRAVLGSEQLQTLAREAALRFRVATPEVRIVDASVTPLILALRRKPVIVLPGELLNRLSDEQVSGILSHELAHLARRDQWANLLSFAIVSLFWWNPIAWLARGAMRRLQDQCCDALVIQTEAAPRRLYAETLLEVLTYLQSENAWLPTLANGLQQNHTLVARFQMLANPKVSAFQSAWTMSLIVAVSLLITCTLTHAQQAFGTTPQDSAVVPPSLPHPLPPDFRSNAADRSAIWTENSVITGQILNHRCQPVANAEVQAHGGIQPNVVEMSGSSAGLSPGRRSVHWSPSPSSARTDAKGEFSLTVRKSTANRLVIISPDPLLWIVYRKNLPASGPVKITLPASGNLIVHCDIPSLPSEVPVVIQLRSLDGINWNPFLLLIHRTRPNDGLLKNPGLTIFDQLPPGYYSVEYGKNVAKDGRLFMVNPVDRQLAEVKPQQITPVYFRERAGPALTGYVRGLEKQDLYYAHVTIYGLGPGEELGRDGKRVRHRTGFEFLPIGADGKFHVDHIPPGDYSMSLRAYTQKMIAPSLTPGKPAPHLHHLPIAFSGDLEFTIPEKGDPPVVELPAKPHLDR